MKEAKIKKSDVLKEVKFTIAKDAFKGPIKCCGKLTKETAKKSNIKGIKFNSSVWKCIRCGSEYLDSEKAKRMEFIWAIEKLLEDKLIRIERHVNFDGKTYFLRFPKEFTKNWGKNRLADIKVINPELFLVEIRKN